MNISERTELTKKQIWDALRDYWKYTNTGKDIYERVSETFVDQLAKDAIAAKAGLRAILRKSPAWDEKLDALVINGNITHEPDYHKIAGLVQDILGPAIRKYPEKCVAISNAICFFIQPDATERQKQKYISAINVLAPRAYAPGKKISRVLKGLCDALGVTDESANSEFQRKFAQVADELNSRPLGYKLFVSINPAHFLTMSNPKGDSRGSCLTSCHSFNSDDYEYNSGCTGYARDGVTMIAFTVSDPDNPETLNNRKTTRQLYMYKPGSGLLLQSRMYNTNGGTTGAQEKSKVYRDLIEREICRGEQAVNRWIPVTYYDNNKGIRLDRDYDFGGYADWEYEEFAAVALVRKDRTKTFQNYEIGAASLCPECGREHDGCRGLFCDECTNGYTCDCCGDNFNSNNLTTVYNSDGRAIMVCDNCLENYYAYCDNCGEYHPLDESHWIESEERNVCEDCFEENYAECEDCGQPFRKSDLTGAIDGYGHSIDVCDRCLENHYVQCEDCGEYVHTDYSYTVYDDTDDERTVCEDCRDNGYAECDICDKWYPAGCMKDGLCPDCQEENEEDEEREDVA